MTAATQDELNSLFIFLSGVLVFFMHAGFGMLEVGGVQAKNSKNILLKNLVAHSASPDPSPPSNSHHHWSLRLLLLGLR